MKNSIKFYSSNLLLLFLISLVNSCENNYLLPYEKLVINDNKIQSQRTSKSSIDNNKLMAKKNSLSIMLNFGHIDEISIVHNINQFLVLTY